MNCPRRSSSLGDPERLREREQCDLERDLERLFPFPLDLDRRCDEDLVLLAERRFVRLLERDLRFVLRLDLDRDRRGGVDRLDLLDEREREGCGLLESDRLRFKWRDDGEGDADLERDFELDSILLYILGGVNELSLPFLTGVSDLSLCFLSTLGDGVRDDFLAFLEVLDFFFSFLGGVVIFLAFLSFLEWDLASLLFFSPSCGELLSLSTLDILCTLNSSKEPEDLLSLGVTGSRPRVLLNFFL